MKAIETEYNGYKFRSRLEARWAVFFDTMGIKYEYEPEGYESEDGTRYLPDFYFSELGFYAEVKGNSSHLLKDVEKIEAFVRENKESVIFLADIPFSEESKGLYFFPEIFCMRRLGVTYSGYRYMNFEVWDTEVVAVDYLAMQTVEWRKGTWRWNVLMDENKANERLWKAIQPKCGEELDSEPPTYRERECAFDELSLVQKAIKQARQARFEHGQKGATK